MTKGKTGAKTRDKKRKLSIEAKTPLVAAVGENHMLKRKNSISEGSIKLQSDVKSINEKMMKEGERLFFTQLPEKIIQLTDYIKTQPLLKMSLEDIRQEISVDQYVYAYMSEQKEKELVDYVNTTHKSYLDWKKKQKHLQLASDSEPKECSKHSKKEDKKDKTPSVIEFPKECVIPINTHLASMIDFIKKEVRECIVLCSAIKMWITLKIPRMEDGNNFGVAIQEECVDTISEIEDDAYSILEAISTYHVSRGKYISQMATYPSIMDFAKCIAQVDESQFFNIKLSIISLRNNYALLYDLIIKNLEKLQAPTTHTESLSLY